jgi:hypothetical protein
VNGRPFVGGLAVTLLLANLTTACTPTVTADRQSQPDFLVELDTPGVEPAIIEPKQVWWLVAEKEVWVSRLDDQASAGPWTKIKVTPGPHCVLVDTSYNSILWPEFPRSEPLCFEAEPGGLYQVDHAYKGPENFFWVIDKNSKQVVAGSPPG